MNSGFLQFFFSHIYSNLRAWHATTLCMPGVLRIWGIHEKLPQEPCLLFLSGAPMSLPPAYVVRWEGTVFTGVCLLTFSGGGGGDLPSRQGRVPPSQVWMEGGGTYLPRWGEGTYLAGRGGYLPSQVGGTYLGMGYPHLGNGVPSCLGRGYLPTWGYPQQGVPPSSGQIPGLGGGGFPLPEQHSVYLLRWRAVYLLRSRRRTFLLSTSFTPI